MKLILEIILSLFNAGKKVKEIQGDNFLKKDNTLFQPVTKKQITLDDWITSSGKYKDRANSKELTQEIKDNATLFLDKLNKYLDGMNIAAQTLKVSSGFRPSGINAAIGGAKKSGHTLGFAIDFQDSDGKLEEMITTDASQDLLESLGLWQEHPDYTNGWVHIDCIKRETRVRPNCKKRQFKP